MRNLQLSFNQTQKVRLEKALERLESLSSKSNPNSCVTVGDTIPVYEDGILKGHGTSDQKGELAATVCGVVERINKLIYVRALRARYKPETGDIVIGRVIEVVPKRWKLEINFTQDAILMLSSMNLPDGIQRRRTAVDELNMRSIFTENDLVCAEVRSSQGDGSLQLQARNQKYGKLERGQLLTVDPYLVKRRKQHFHHLEEYGIDLIIGCNGYIWIGEHVEARDKTAVDQGSDSEQPITKYDKISMDLDEQDGTCTPREARQNVCRIAIFLFGIRSLVVWHCLLFHVVHVSGICFIRSQGARFISCYLHRRECLYYMLLLRCMYYFSSGNLCPSGLGSACLCHHSKYHCYSFIILFNVVALNSCLFLPSGD